MASTGAFARNKIVTDPKARNSCENEEPDRSEVVSDTCLWVALDVDCDEVYYLGEAFTNGAFRSHGSCFKTRGCNTRVVLNNNVDLDVIMPLL